MKSEQVAIPSQLFNLYIQPNRWHLGAQKSHMTFRYQIYLGPCGWMSISFSFLFTLT